MVVGERHDEPQVEKRSMLRLSTAGSVDDGKSTLIGRLLMDLHAVHEDTIANITQRSKKYTTDGKMSLALVTDGLKAEQEQGITIDVAYRYFTSKKRRFILGDSPGHEQYTRNMATAASTADLTIILIDATKGVLAQTKRHAFVASLMGVPRLLIAINKMDRVGFKEEVFESIREDFSSFAAKLAVSELKFIPISALNGDNVVASSTNISWYHGETILEYLENVYIGSDANLVDFRFPVQSVIRDSGTYRGYAGQIASGTIQVGEEIMVLPSRQQSRVKRIEFARRSAQGATKAQAFESIVLCLEDEIDISRGDMIVRARNAPALKTQFEAMMIWMAEEKLQPHKQYLIRHATTEAKVYVDAPSYRVDVETLGRVPAATVGLNDIARLSFTCSKALPIDPYQRNRSTGNFILIDPESFTTVAAGMVIDRIPAQTYTKGDVTQNLHQEVSLVTFEERKARAGMEPMTIWFSGLSGSGKSSITKALERALFDLKIQVYRLDGDNLRTSINKGLGFSQEDRAENLRRAAEVAKLMNDAGIVVLASFITPREADRNVIAQIVGKEKLVQVYLNTALSVCEERDPHGLYKKSRAGLIREFTGVSSPFEEPLDPTMTFDTAEKSLGEIVETLLAYIVAQRV